MRVGIQYEDKDILVIYKPAGLATQTSKVGQADVVSELKNYLKGGYVGVVHRLDQPVEGLLVFGKTKQAAAVLTSQLSKGVLNKHYYAVVCGQPEESEGELVDYLIKTPENLARVVEKSHPEAKKAVLRYKVCESMELAPGGGELQEDSPVQQISLVDVHIETGRFHQIRCQMSHAGVPLLGDQKYGSEDSLQMGKALNVRNVALCACEITLEHPTTHKKMQFQIKPTGIIFNKFSILKS